MKRIRQPLVISGKTTIKQNSNKHRKNKGVTPRTKTSGEKPAKPATTKALIPMGGVRRTILERKTKIMTVTIGSNPAPNRSGQTVVGVIKAIDIN